MIIWASLYRLLPVFQLMPHIYAGIEARVDILLTLITDAMKEFHNCLFTRIIKLSTQYVAHTVTWKTIKQQFDLMFKTMIYICDELTFNLKNSILYTT